MNPRPRPAVLVAVLCALCGAAAGMAVWTVLTRPNTAQEHPAWPPSRSSTSKP